MKIYLAIDTPDGDASNCHNSYLRLASNQGDQVMPEIPYGFGPDIPFKYVNTQALFDYLYEASQYLWPFNGGQKTIMSMQAVVEQKAITHVFAPQSANVQVESAVFASYTVDNRNGLNPRGEAKLGFDVETSLSVTHEEGSSTTIGTSIEQKLEYDFLAVQGETTVSFNFEYEWHSSDSKTITKTDTTHFEQTVPCEVPTGKVYQAVIVGSKQTVDLPYYVGVFLSGTTQIAAQGYSIGDSVGILHNPAFNRDAASVTQDFIVNPNDSEAAFASAYRGILAGQQSVKFTSHILDVTAVTPPLASHTGSSEGDTSAQQITSGSSDEITWPPPEGVTIVATFPVGTAFGATAIGPGKPPA